MGHIYSATTEGEVALASGTKTLLAVFGGSAARLKILEWGISFDGVTAADPPVQVNLVRMTVDDGTRTTTVTEAKWDADSPTAVAAARKTYTVEGTKGDYLARYEVHPQGGSLIVQYPLGREIIVPAATASGLAIETVFNSTGTNGVAYIVWEE